MQLQKINQDFRGDVDGVTRANIGRHVIAACVGKCSSALSPVPYKIAAAKPVDREFDRVYNGE